MLCASQSNIILLFFIIILFSVQIIYKTQLKKHDYMTYDWFYGHICAHLDYMREVNSIKDDGQTINEQKLVG